MRNYTEHIKTGGETGATAPASPAKGVRPKAPCTRHGVRALIILAALAFAITCIYEAAYAAENERCLKCHSKHGIVKKFQSGESVDAYVNADAFAASVHSSLSCDECHRDFLDNQHPTRTFRSKLQYMIRESLNCRRCHELGKLKRSTVHNIILSDEEHGDAVHPCTNCHNPHSTQSTAGSRFIKEEQYCLKCHGYELSMEFRDGEAISLKVDPQKPHLAVHRNLSCSDCHYGFTLSRHVKRNFKSRRDFTIAHSETCRRCHFDKYTKSMEGIHYIMFSRGDLNTPVCTDCHGSHSIMHFGEERILIAKRCRQCHAGIFDSYIKSVHGRALVDVHNKDVPVCIDCHNAHDIEDPRTADYRESTIELCSSCHADEAVMNKYGLSTNVVKTYLSDFHGITLGLYKKERQLSNKPGRLIAICTDCHGSHDIASTQDASATAFKSNLLERCRQCHKDAGPNFPDAWLSHYEPSLRKAPMVFIAQTFYTFFIPVLGVAIALQILLHIWRYAINR